MPLFPFTASLSFHCPKKCDRITSFSPQRLTLTCSSSNISLPRKLPRNVDVFGNSSPFSYYASTHRTSYSRRQIGISLIALDAKNSESGGGDNQVLDVILKLFSAIRNKNTHELSEILAGECRCVFNFFSLFQAFQGKKQALDFFCYLIKIFGDNVQIVLKPTMHDDMNVGVQWKFTMNNIQVPLGKGFSFHIWQTYQEKAVIRNIEMFMEPLLYIEPSRLKMTASLNAFLENIGSLMSQRDLRIRKNRFCVVCLLCYFHLPCYTSGDLLRAKPCDKLY